MSEFDVNTGDAPPRRRYRVSYRARLHNTNEPWIAGEIQVISRSPAEAEAFVRQIIGENRYEFELSDCHNVAEEHGE